MKKVVDCSGLESAELAAMLAESPENYVVISDFCSKEAHGRGKWAIQSFEQLARNSGQIIQLKPTAAISRLRPRSSGLRNRLIDKKLTEAFSRYIVALTTHTPALLEHLSSNQSCVRQFLDDFLPASESIKSEMLATLSTYSKSELSILRSGRINNALARRIEVGVAKMTHSLFTDTLRLKRTPPVEDVKYSFPFRLAVTYYSLMANWGRTGGLGSRTVPDIRNDINDCTYAAYASFFDGLITCDQRLVDTYNLSLKLLVKVFHVAVLSAQPTTKALKAERSEIASI